MNTVLFLWTVTGLLWTGHAFLENTVLDMLYHMNKLKLDPEIEMNTTQLITSKGYPCEDYDVVTDDGYILSVQRIPHGRNNSHSDAPLPVVLLQHGLLSCSACWVENLVNESLGFMMADAGFDVWLGNSRGNTYGKRHKTLSPDEKEFWQFSWDDMALHDLPATIGKILTITGATELFYVGHSQGGGIGYAAFSSNPELGKTIKMFAPLAPAVYVADLKSPLKKLAPFAKELEVLATLLGVNELLPHGELTKYLAEDLCDKEIPSYVCENFLFVICGFDEAQMNRSRVPVYVGQHPAGTSSLNLIHYVQMIDDITFKMFDFGADGNMKKYNQTTPPVYDLSRMEVPVMMFYGTNDWLVTPTDVAKLMKETKNLVSTKLIQGWEHLDFIWAMDAPKECYNDVIQGFKNVL